jgi:hypothetical protein
MGQVPPNDQPNAPSCLSTVPVRRSPRPRPNIGQNALVVILRYETEARQLVNTVERANEVPVLSS